jgi:hypothetical protein
MGNWGMRTIEELAADFRASNGSQLSCEEAHVTYVGVLNEMSNRTFVTRGEDLEARERVLHQFHIEWEDANYRKSLLNMLKPFLPDTLLADVTDMAESLASA